MIQRLDQLSLQQFISLCCGDTSVLKEHDDENEKALADKAIELASEYKAIATPGKAKIEMLDGEQKQKLLMKEKCTRIILALAEFGRIDYALEVLKELDVDTSKLTSPEEVVKKCKAMNNDARFELDTLADRKREQDTAPKDEAAIRKAWYGEIAWVMSVFKMSIDVNAVNAAIYANLVQQAVQRMKRMAKMPPMMRNVM